MAEGLNDMLGLRTTGRSAKPLVVLDWREVTQEDILATRDERGTKPVAIKTLRQRHHALAKLLADGVPQSEAAIHTGYTDSHISVLKQDPSFKDLLKFYSEKKDERYVEMHDKIAGLGEDAIDEITSRLEEDPSEFSLSALLEVSKMALDRSGHGPQTSTNVNVNVGLADKLAQGRKRALEAKANALRAAQMIDITPEEDDA
jgi:hypothetical protein